MYYVSKPIKSARASGPIGTFVPNFIHVSIPSTVETPSYRAYTASLIYGINIRLAINPGESLASTTTLPIYPANSLVTDKVYQEVYNPLITSTKVITGTGFIKCMPIILSGRLVTAAIFVRDIDEVLDDKIVSGLVTLSRVSKRIFFV